MMNSLTKQFYRYALTLVCLLLQQTMWAQYSASSLEEKSLKEIKNTAKSALRLGDSYTALAHYEEWSNRASDNLNLVEKTADLYRITRNYKEAEKWYLKLIEKGAEGFPLSYFFLGEVQMAQEKYAEAKKNYEKFKKLSREIKDPSYRKLVKNRLLSCTYAIASKDSTATALSKHLSSSVNMPHIEFSPISVGPNVMIYGSLKEKNVNLYDIDKVDSLKMPVRKLYVAEREGEEWVSKGEFDGPFNQNNKNIGNAVLSEDGKRLYFTYCEKNWQKRIVCEIFLSEKESESWSEPVKLNEEINLANYTTTQPAIGRAAKSNQEVLYFVSDRPGGKGGLDIWYTEYNKKRKYFKSPRNAGSKINSVGTECTPFYDLASHRLYFSSDGHVGLGGLDIYSVNGEKSKWEEPRVLKASINSSADDLDFTLHKSKEGGFLVSNRKGGAALLSETCCDDIYEFTYSEYVKISAEGKIMDGNEVLSNYKVNVYIEDKESNDRYLSQSYRIDTDQYEIKLEEGQEYSIEIEKDGYLTIIDKINTKNIKESKTITKRLQVEKIPSKPVLLLDILYEFNSPKLTAGAMASIDTTLYLILTNNPTIKVRIGSHTDSKGTNAYNQSLSQKRAQSVVKYLISKGVRKERLVAKGYGESQAIAPNTNEDGSDNPEGRRLNRRTEFEIIGKVDLIEPVEDSE
ncbi:MAG: OmpA family protein [Flavobacteriales bacterium]|nr:OmpA family protein [Flavobacteriales bacterium]